MARVYQRNAVLQEQLSNCLSVSFKIGRIRVHEDDRGLKTCACGLKFSLQPLQLTLTDRKVGSAGTLRHHVQEQAAKPTGCECIRQLGHTQTAVEVV